MLSADLNPEQFGMDGHQLDGRNRFGSGRKAFNSSYRDRVPEPKSPTKTPHTILPLKPPLGRARELHLARKKIDQFDERKRESETAKGEAETELLEGKKTVEELTMWIEGSNSSARADMQKLRQTRRFETSRASSVLKKTENDEYAEVMKELEHVKKELSRLKLDMASVFENKKKAEEEADASVSKTRALSDSVDRLQKEIDEVNEEQVLVELARIEAVKELGAIEDQRKEESKKFSVAMEETKKKMIDIMKGIDKKKQLEMKLTTTYSDVDMLQSELKFIKEKGKEGGQPPPSSLQSVMEELEAAKRKLAAIREEGFQFMASMDIIRSELKHVFEEKARLEKSQRKEDLTVERLNSKLLRAKAKLEEATAAEESSKSIVSSMMMSVKKLKADAEEARKEKEKVCEETKRLRVEVQKTDAEIIAAEELMEAAMEELEAVKASEAAALEKLKELIESTVTARTSASQHTSKITISAFEYEYMTGKAKGAEELADKKVAAAQAWVEALRASEKEILLQTENLKRELGEAVDHDHEAERGKEAYRNKRSLSVKRVTDGDLRNWKVKREKNLDNIDQQHEMAMPKRSMNRSHKGMMTPVRQGQAKLQRSDSLAVRSGKPSASSFPVRRRRKVVPSLSKIFNLNHRNN